MYEVVTFHLEGISGLLMHNPAGSMGQKDTTTAQRSGKKIPKPFDEARASLYADTPDTRVNDEPAQLFLPADAVREAGIIASKSFRDPTRRGNATKEQRFSASVFLSQERFQLTNPDGKPLMTDATDDAWVVHTKRAVVQGQGIMRSRALVPLWACDGEFEYDTDTFTPVEVGQILWQAGKFPGLLDYRPGKKGPFGRFSLVSINGEPVDG